MSIETKNPTISVILPFYNAEKTLARAIESILNQTFFDFELILIDNNSTDKSLQISNGFAQTDSRILLLKEEKQGVSFAMNCGLENAKGKYLARMDADDFSMPERLEKQYRFLEENPEIGFVGSDVKYFSHDKNTKGFARFVNWANSFHSAQEIKINRFIDIPVINPSLIFRREIFEEFGGCLQGNFPEDYEMQLRYLQAGVKMIKLQEPLLEWYDSTNRLTRTDEHYSSDAFFKIKAKYFLKWSEQNNPFHPKIWIWGAGRKTRQRAKLLEKEGLKTEGLIDIVEHKSNSLFYKKIPNPGKIFIVSMVTNVGAGEQIREFLLQRKYVEGVDFMMLG